MERPYSGMDMGGARCAVMARHEDGEPIYRCAEHISNHARPLSCGAHLILLTEEREEKACERREKNAPYGWKRPH